MLEQVLLYPRDDVARLVERLSVDEQAGNLALSADGGTAAFVSRRPHREAPPKVTIHDVRSGRTLQVDWLERLGAPKR